MLSPQLLNIVLSYCSEQNEIDALLELIDRNYVTEIHACGDAVSASVFKNLRVLNLSRFYGNLAPLRGMSLTTLNLYRFTGDLAPLRGMPLTTLYLYRFTGDLAPLRGMP